MAPELNINEALINAFYSAFQQKDYKTMQTCYAENAVFSDPVFQKLDAVQVKAMWEMFCVKNSSLEIEFGSIQTDDNRGSAFWQARYIFPSTGRRVVNRIHSSFQFSNGKIIEQTDRFSFYKWSVQALAITGFIAGWTPPVKKRVQARAMHSLDRFINKNKQFDY